MCLGFKIHDNIFVLAWYSNNWKSKVFVVLNYFLYEVFTNNKIDLYKKYIPIKNNFIKLFVDLKKQNIVNKTKIIYQKAYVYKT